MHVLKLYIKIKALYDFACIIDNVKAEIDD